MTSTAADARVRADAEQVGVCVRPLVQSLVDTTTGEETYVAIPCGSTQQRVCPSCAAKALRVRQQQCREGWHLDTELPAVIVPRLVGLHVDDAAAKASEHVTLTAPHAGPRPIPTGDRTLNDPKVGPLPAAWSFLRVVPTPSTRRPGTVLRQSPSPGRRMSPDRPIRVEVSTGSIDPHVVAPELVGLDLDDAARKAFEVVALAGPLVGPRPLPDGRRTLQAPHVGPLPLDRCFVDPVPQRSDQPCGTILEQHPAPGEQMPATSPIRLVVSAGPDGPEPVPAEPAPVRVQRSTKRREDAPPIPKVPMSSRTIGRTLTSPSGRTYNPSMFITLTLGSYGPVHSDSTRGCTCGQRHRDGDPLVGAPLHPASYDYRQAALDAMHFPKLIDHFWRMMRRCSGFDVQYFATLEAQKRLTLHMHAAVRGTIPASRLRAIVAATYVQIWWPTIDQPVYVGDRLPVWDEDAGVYVDPDTRQPLDTFDSARARAEEPAHVMWFGEQVDRQWFLPGTKRSDKRIGYLTKYLTKSIAEAYDPDTISEQQKAHRDRLARETKYLPCTPECANWLRFGVQPKNPKADMRPGECGRRAHRRDNLGHGGRRVLVSEQWSAKTLDQHRADRARVVKAALAEAGIAMPDRQRCSTTATTDDGRPRYWWKPVDISSTATPAAYRRILDATIAERITWQNEYDDAKLAAARAADQAHRNARARPSDLDPRTYRRWASRQSVRQPAASAA